MTQADSPRESLDTRIHRLWPRDAPALRQVTIGITRMPGLVGGPPGINLAAHPDGGCSVAVDDRHWDALSDAGMAVRLAGAVRWWQPRHHLIRRVERRYGIEATVVGSSRRLEVAHALHYGGNRSLLIPAALAGSDDGTLDHYVLPAVHAIRFAEAGDGGDDIATAEAESALRSDVAEFARRLETPEPAVVCEPTRGRLCYYERASDTLRAETAFLVVVPRRSARPVVAHEMTHKVVGAAQLFAIVERVAQQMTPIERLLGRAIRSMNDVIAAIPDETTKGLVAALGRHHELIADLGAVQLTGDVEAVCDSLMYTAHSHPRYSQPGRRGVRIDDHPTIAERITLVRTVGARLLAEGNTFPLSALRSTHGTPGQCAGPAVAPSL